VGPFRKMTFASRMQHKIYWGPLKKPIEWSLKTVLAPWAYLASVVYHDSFWYPVKAKRMMHTALASDWGRLFRNWEHLTPDENGFPVVEGEGADLTRAGLRAFATSLGILGTCIKEAPEFSNRKRKVVTRQQPVSSEAFGLGFGLWALGLGPWALGFGLWALGFGPAALGLGLIGMS